MKDLDALLKLVRIEPVFGKQKESYDLLYSKILKNQEIVKHLEDCEECQQYGNGFCKTYGDLT